MKPTLTIAVLAAGLAVAFSPVLLAADQAVPAPPPPPPAAAGDRAPDAHPPRGPRDGMGQLEHLKRVLNLTQEQSDQIAAIIKGNAPARQAIWSDDSLSRDEKRAKMQELRKGTDAQIRALLTPDQQEKFDAMPRGPEGRRGPRRDSPPPPQAGDGPPPPPPSESTPPDAPPAPASPPAGNT